MPHVKLIQTMKSDRDGLVSYLGGLMLDKLEKITGEVPVEKEYDEWDEEVPAAKPQTPGGQTKHE